jgi:hypothetical protein
MEDVIKKADRREIVGAVTDEQVHSNAFDISVRVSEHRSGLRESSVTPVVGMCLLQEGL